jgi:hypothetical protein
LLLTFAALIPGCVADAKNKGAVTGHTVAVSNASTDSGCGNVAGDWATVSGFGTPVA